MPDAGYQMPDNSGFREAFKLFGFSTGTIDPPSPLGGGGG
jgi:hypothetical protein